MFSIKGALKCSNCEKYIIEHVFEYNTCSYECYIEKVKEMIGRKNR